LQKQKKAKITDIKNSFIAKIKLKSWVSFLLPVLFQATWQTTTYYPTDATTKQTAKRANVPKKCKCGPHVVHHHVGQHLEMVPLSSLDGTIISHLLQFT